MSCEGKSVGCSCGYTRNEIPTFDRIIHLVRGERTRQDAKWGVQDHDPYRWHAILSEEIGETAKAILENEFSNSYAHNADHIAVELIQSAAVIFATLDCFDRHELINLDSLSLDA